MVAARPPTGATRLPPIPAPTPTVAAAMPAFKAPAAAVALRPTPTPAPAPMAARPSTTAQTHAGAAGTSFALLRADVSLVASDLHPSPASATTGQRLSVRADVRNLGGAPAEGVRVAFTLTNAAGALVGKGEVAVGTIAAHGVGSASWAVTLPAGGPWRVTAVANATADAQVGNNRAAVGVGLAKAVR
jgi:hypothetical protein